MNPFSNQWHSNIGFHCLAFDPDLTTVLYAAPTYENFQEKGREKEGSNVGRKEENNVNGKDFTTI